MISQSCPEMYGVEIHDIDLHHLPTIGSVYVDHQFYIEIFVDGCAKTKQVTSKVKPSSMPWTRKHTFANVHDATTLTLKVYAHRQLHDDRYIGMVQGPMEEFLRYPGAILRQLVCNDTRKTPRTSLEFKISSTGRPVQVTSSQNAAKTPLPPAVQIFDIDLHHLPRIGLVSADDRKFFVRAFAGTRDHKSTTAKKLHSLPWTTQLDLNVHSSSAICLKVFAKRLLHDDELVGEVEEGVETLLAHPGTHIHRLMPPDGHDKKHPLRASIEFKIIPLDSRVAQEDESTRDARPIPGSKECGLNNISLVGAGVVGSATGAAAAVAITPLLDAFTVNISPLLEKIDIFLKVAGKFAKAHPYLSMAFAVLTAAHQVVHAQRLRDLSIQQLIRAMHDVFSLIADEEELKKIPLLEETVDSIARETINCSYFIRDYLETKAGVKNCIRNIFSNIDNKIQAYEANFKKLQDAIHSRSSVQSLVDVRRLYDMIIHHVAKSDIREMRYVHDASYKAYRASGVSPRADIMDSVTSWVNKDAEARICLLLGSKDSDRSNIAHAIARQFDTISHLGSSYFFSRAATDRNATNLFSTIAQDLADHDPQYMKALWDVVGPKRSIRGTKEPLLQFTFFILNPLAAGQETRERVGPVLVVIDGLEYSGGQSAHSDVLNALAEEGAKLPEYFKLLITCRPDENICAAFKGKSHVLQIPLESPHDVSLSHESDPLQTPRQTQTCRPRPHRTPHLCTMLTCETTKRRSPSEGACYTSALSDPPLALDTSSSDSDSDITEEDDDQDWDEMSLRSAVSHIDEESQHLRKKSVVRVIRQEQIVTTVKISKTRRLSVKRRDTPEGKSRQRYVQQRAQRSSSFESVVSVGSLDESMYDDPPPPYENLG